jgi:hypothetical protein
MDNTILEAWSNKVTSGSLQDQQLIGLLAALLQLLEVRHNSWHIPGGTENIITDFILHMTHFSLSHFE